MFSKIAYFSKVCLLHSFLELKNYILEWPLSISTCTTISSHIHAEAQGWKMCFTSQGKIKGCAKFSTIVIFVCTKSQYCPLNRPISFFLNGMSFQNSTLCSSTNYIKRQRRWFSRPETTTFNHVLTNYGSICTILDL